MLEIQELVVNAGRKVLVDSVDVTVDAGERLGIIGESGSGKSMTALSVLGLQPSAVTVNGSVFWKGRNLLELPEKERASVRGREIGMVFQEPLTALNPIRPVGDQIADSLHRHFRISRRDARARAVDAAERVLLPDAEDTLQLFPHELSGGQRQRVAIAQAIITGPQLLIADEPTTALDVTTQAEILGLFDDLVRELDMALLFITHDLAVLSQVASTALVMSGGRGVEQGDVSRLLEDPKEQTTRNLVTAARQTSWAPENFGPDRQWKERP